MKDYVGSPCQLYLHKQSNHLTINTHFARAGILQKGDLIDVFIEDGKLCAKQVSKETETSVVVREKKGKKQNVLCCFPKKSIVEHFLKDGIQPSVVWMYKNGIFSGRQFFPSEEIAIGGNAGGYVIINKEDARKCISETSVYQFYMTYLDGVVPRKDLNGRLRKAGLIV